VLAGWTASDTQNNSLSTDIEEEEEDLTSSKRSLDK